MATRLRIRSDLYSLSRVGKILGIGRQTVADVARCVGLEFKSRSDWVGKLLDREDVERLASVLNVEPDWDAAEPNH